MMLVLLLVGCLTPESFSAKYAERVCEERIVCGFEDVEDCESAADPGLTTETCPDWNAAAAADCLSSASWCDDAADGGGAINTPEICADLGCE